VVAWSHGSRFDLARRLVAPGAGGALLDYGCGDGTFVAMVHDEFARTRGVDVDAVQIADCERRLGHLAGVSFSTAHALTDADLAAWSVVTCMETLEHCLEDERRRIIARLGTLCAPDGLIVISVPIETGPSLAGKQLVRAMAGWRGLGDYRHRERYSTRELLRGVLHRPVPRIKYETRTDSGSFEYYGHKGFDWREVEREASERLRVVRTTFSPMKWSGPWINSQAWFICRPR
jgi:SAM-dependent methyltransferase